MRWVIALVAFGLFAALFYALGIRDRTFDSFGGARVGMGLGAALHRLTSEGYLVVGTPPRIDDNGCSGAERYNLVWAPDPTYLVTISVDRRCKVKEIKRKLRRTWEL